jgi:hypothetical protein
MKSSFEDGHEVVSDFSSEDPIGSNDKMPHSERPLQQPQARHAVDSFLLERLMGISNNKS